MRRIRCRYRPPTITPVSFRVGQGVMAHATLQNLSPYGAGIARPGRLALEVGTPVLLQFHIPGTGRRQCRDAEVRWVRFGGFNTYVGLRFKTPLKEEDPLLAALLGGPDRTLWQEG